MSNSQLLFLRLVHYLVTHSTITKVRLAQILELEPTDIDRLVEAYKQGPASPPEDLF